MPKELTIELVGKNQKLTVDSLIDALERALITLRNLDPKQPQEWEVVKVRMASPLRITLRNPSAQRLVPNYMRGLKKIEKRPVIPSYFSEAEVESSRQLADVVSNGIESLKLSFPGERSVKITAQLKSNLEEVTKKISSFHYEWTTIEGLLDQVTVVGDLAKFRIEHPLTGRAIECRFPPEMLDVVKEALPHRVAVYGRARYNAAGETTSIEVKTFRKLRDRSELPQIEDISGVDITGGIDSVEHIRKVRGGD